VIAVIGPRLVISPQPLTWLLLICVFLRKSAAIGFAFPISAIPRDVGDLFRL
jgi:hypothetical protein